MSPTPHFQPTGDLLDGWRDDVLSGKPPTIYPVGTGELGRVEIGPGLVTLLGGAPGVGKSALIMQLVVDSLIVTPSIRALICNIEMTPSTLLDRQLARLGDIDLTLIRRRQLAAAHAGAIDRGMQILDDLADRLAFVQPPFDLGNVAASADAFGADLIVFDYVQRIGAPGKHDSRRGAVDASMGFLRQFADTGIAIVVVAALARSKDAKGRSSYTDGLNLASFRETSELEYGADDAFILAPEPTPSRVVLKHLKSRHGETRDIALTFDGSRQRFTPAATAPGAPGTPTAAKSSKLTAALRAMWDQTSPAHDATEGKGP